MTTEIDMRQNNCIYPPVLGNVIVLRRFYEGGGTMEPKTIRDTRKGDETNRRFRQAQVKAL